ncbi:MAG: hypothetical protein WBI91_06520 [Coriobacteriia bacterium]
MPEVVGSTETTCWAAIAVAELRPDAAITVAEVTLRANGKKLTATIGKTVSSISKPVRRLKDIATQGSSAATYSEQRLLDTEVAENIAYAIVEFRPCDLDPGLAVGGTLPLTFEATVVEGGESRVIVEQRLMLIQAQPASFDGWVRGDGHVHTHWPDAWPWVSPEWQAKAADLMQLDWIAFTDRLPEALRHVCGMYLDLGVRDVMNQHIPLNTHAGGRTLGSRYAGLRGALGKRALVIGAATAVAGFVYFSLGWLEATFDIEALGEHHLARLGLGAVPVAVVQVLVPAVVFALMAYLRTLAVDGRRKTSSPARQRMLGPFSMGAIAGALAAGILGWLAAAVEGVPIGVFGTLGKLLSAAGWVANHLVFEPLAALLVSRESTTWEALALIRLYASAAVSWVSWGLIGALAGRLRGVKVHPR